jgi:hypothetical protein
VRQKVVLGTRKVGRVYDSNKDQEEKCETYMNVREGMSERGRI